MDEKKKRKRKPKIPRPAPVKAPGSSSGKSKKKEKGFSLGSPAKSAESTGMRSKRRKRTDSYLF